MDDQQNYCYENMKYNNSLKNKDHDQLITITSKSLKKVTKLLLSVSVFSLLLSYSSSLYPIFIHSFKSNSLFPHFQVLLTHILDKNFTFLICNGILVFLAKTSGLLCSRSGFDHHRWRKKINVDGIQMDHPATGTLSEEQPSLLENNDNQDSPNVENYSSVSPNCPLKEALAAAGWDSTDHDEYLLTEGSKNEEQEKGQTKEGRVEEIGFSSTGVGGGSQQDHTNYSFNNDENIEKGSESSFLFGKDDAEEISRLESIKMLSTEELNKRFDEFIRKMKERLRIEAAGQKLIMV